MNRRLLRPIGSLLSLALLAGPAAADDGGPRAVPGNPLGRRLEVPFEHGRHWRGGASIYFELGAPFDPARPTVFVIADAQQFYIRPGAVAEIQSSLFGDGFNVVGIAGRGAEEAFLDRARGPDGRPDWEAAWRLFNADQWIGDIEAVRRAVLGRRGSVLLYGVSGGAHLVVQYLARHGRRVSRAFIAAPVDPFLVGLLGINTDRFWEEIGAHDPALPGLLRGTLERRPAERAGILTTLQRQNFFVPPQRLQEERAALIRALAAGDEFRYAEARRLYQVDAVHALIEAPGGTAIRVRLFELFHPSGALGRLGGAAIHPDLENQYNVARPLVELCAAGRIPPPSFDAAALHRLRTEVFVLAGRFDHTVDYRAAIALAGRFPRHHLFLAATDHLFNGMKDDGAYADLLRVFLGSGLEGPGLPRALAAALPHRWSEGERRTAGAP